MAVFHPFVSLCYFASVIFCSMFFSHPILLLISLFGAVFYAWTLKLKTLRFLPVFLLAMLLNPIFSHEGMTVLFYLPSGNPYTLESLVYGGKVALTLMSTVCWCYCFQRVMTGEKIHCLLSRVAPTLGLVFSQILALIPRFFEQTRAVIRAQKGLGRAEDKRVFVRMKRSIETFSTLTTWALEHAIETADSMKARGYGLPGRSAFTRFRFSVRDWLALALVFLTLAACLLTRGLAFRYFPTIRWSVAPGGILGALSYFLLCFYPVILSVWEVRRWNN